MDKIYIFCLSIILYTIYAFFSFKMYDSLFYATPSSSSSSSSLYSEIDILKHEEIGDDENFLAQILYNGVCQIGKFGAWLLIGWSIALIVLLCIYKDDESILKKLGAINLILCIIYGYALTSNWALFVRSIPYLLAQFFISIYIMKL